LAPELPPPPFANTLPSWVICGASKPIRPPEPPPHPEAPPPPAAPPEALMFAVTPIVIDVPEIM
jgi:hypothetical protein